MDFFYLLFWVLKHTYQVLNLMLGIPILRKRMERMSTVIHTVLLVVVG